MDIIVKGIVREVLPMQQGVSQKTGNAWQSQAYLLEHESGQYPRFICFTVFGAEKISNMGIMEGEEITAHLNIDAKKGQKGYFNDIQCWRVEREAQGQNAQQEQQAPQMVNQPGLGNAPTAMFPSPQPQAPQAEVPAGDSDLPF